MRFRDVLEDYVIEEWADFYIDFLALKYELDQIDKNAERDRRRQFLKVRSTSFHWNDAHVLQLKARPEALSNNVEDLEANASNHDDSPIRYPLLVRPTEKTIWERKLKDNIQKVEGFFQHKKQEINHFFNYFIESLKKVYQKDAFQGAHFFSEIYERSEVSAEQISLRYGNKKIMAEIFTELLCLESYCIINMLSCNILIKLYAAKFGSVTDEEIHELFQLEKCEFTNINQITKFKDVIVNYVANNLTKGDVQKANEILRKNNTIKLEELAKIAFFLGIVCSTLFVLVVAAWIEFHTEGSSLVQIFFSSFQVYRFVFCSLLAFWYVTITRYILQLKHLNFNFVLDIRPSNMGDINQIIKLQTYSTFVFLVAVVLDIFFCSGVALSGAIAAPNIIGLLLFLSTLITALLPLRSFLLDIKYALAKLILECLCSPFTRVAFIHILAADCLTSFNKVILDVVNSFCWVYEGGWKDVSQNADCNFSRLGTILVLAFPYYIRLMQCLKRYYVSRLVFPNIFNAVKYCISIATIIISNLGFDDYPSLLPAFYVVGFTSFFYNNYWDNYNDWGLFREKWSSDKKLLRSKLTFSPRFYYTIMILNFFLRLNSMATLMPKSAIVQMFEDPNLFTLLIETLEITRRFLWAIIRIEYELFSNFEKLRDFWVVPNVYYLKGQRKKKLQAL